LIVLDPETEAVGSEGAVPATVTVSVASVEHPLAAPKLTV
jgi:hypothetical protein